MREPMHPIYTMIPQRSFDAYVKRGDIVEVMCALIVDPNQAYAMAREYGVRDTPHSLSDFEKAGGSDAVETALLAASIWTMQQGSADTAISDIVYWDRRVAVWCACQVARTVLRFIPAGEDKSLRAIITAEAWVDGRADISQVRASAMELRKTYRPSATSYSNANASAHYAAESAISDSAAFNAVRMAAQAIVYSHPDYRTPGFDSGVAVREELVRLREVIADACLTFPR